MSTDEALNNSVLPAIPLSPVVQSYITCSNALKVATERLEEAKKAKPPVQVGILRGLMDTFKIESQRLATITRKMQTVEAATAIFWDADALARQIAVIDSQLYSQVVVDKRSLFESTKHFTDFHHYTTHSVAHQLIYWGELLNNSVAASAVVPTVNPNKDSLVSHFIRVAYLLLHAYRDFSGFAAIMKALTFPEVRRLKKLWHNCNSRTKDMFRELVQIISPTKNYHAYHTTLRTKLELHVNKSSLRGGDVMVAIPWIQPHLLSIRSIIAAYTAGEDQLVLGGDIILSTPGANKLDIEISVLEICQHQSFTSDFTLDEILSANGLYDIKPTNTKRASVHQKAIHLDGLREAVVPVSNLKHLAPGEQLIHHWLVSRAYLRKDQLINESMEVEPLKQGERIECETDELDEALFRPTAISSATSRRSSRVILADEQDEQEMVDMTHDAVVPESPTVEDVESVKSDDDDHDEDQSGDDPLTTEVLEQQSSNEEEFVEQELVDMSSQRKEEEEEEVKEVELKEMEPLKKSEPKSVAKSVSVKSTTSSKSKSKLSPSAPVFVPGSSYKQPSVMPNKTSSVTSDEKWTGYPVNEQGSEKWGGYPAPEEEEEEDEDEVWKGYPGPISFSNSPRRASSQSETSEEWKGYQATKMEADWQRESELKVQEHEWQGYTLETLDEDELDSSTMMNGEFEKSRKARR